MTYRFPPALIIIRAAVDLELVEIVVGTIDPDTEHQLALVLMLYERQQLSWWKERCSVKIRAGG